MCSAHQKNQDGGDIILPGCDDGWNPATDVGVVWQVSDQWVHISKIDLNKNLNNSNSSNVKLLSTYDMAQVKSGNLESDGLGGGINESIRDECFGLWMI